MNTPVNTINFDDSIIQRSSKSKYYDLIKYEITSFCTYFLAVIIIIISTVLICVNDKMEIQIACIQIINSIISGFIGAYGIKKI